MSKIFFLGFFMLVTSTIAFIVAILTPFWILKETTIRGIFESCLQVDSVTRTCVYILIYNSNPFIVNSRQDYAIACASLSIAASSIGIILLWISGIHMCLKGKMDQHRVIRMRTAEVLIAGTLLTTCITIVVWVVMLAKNLNSNNVITTSEIGWSLWLAVASTGGFLIALVLFCIHRIDLGASLGKRSSSYTDSREYLQRF